MFAGPLRGSSPGLEREVPHMQGSSGFPKRTTRVFPASVKPCQLLDPEARSASCQGDCWWEFSPSCSEGLSPVSSRLSVQTPADPGNSAQGSNSPCWMSVVYFLSLVSVLM